MPVESATYISQLNPLWPLGSDSRSNSDDHHRLGKSVLQNQFPNLGAAAVTPTATSLNGVGVTQTLTDNSTLPASTAFVQGNIALVNAATGTTFSVVSATSATATAGQHLGLTNVALTTITLPASPTAGQYVAVTPMNGLATNVIARNGLNIMGLAEDMTLNNPFETVTLRYTNVAQGWRKI